MTMTLAIYRELFAYTIKIVSVFAQAYEVGKAEICLKGKGHCHCFTKRRVSGFRPILIYI